MADMRMLEFTRKWNKRVLVVIPQTEGTLTGDVSLGTIRLGTRALILKAYLTVGANIAKASATVDSVDIQLFDRKAANTGIINVSDGVCVISTGTVTSATAAFVTNEVNVGDLITLSGGTPVTNAGVYRVTAVVSETELTLDTTFTVASTAEDVDMTGQIGVDTGNVAAAIVKNIVDDFAADGYIVAEDSVIEIYQEWTVAATPGAIVLTAPTIIVEYIPLPAV